MTTFSLIFGHCKEIEDHRRRELAYRPSPPPELSVLPSAVYQPRSTPTSVQPVATIDPKESDASPHDKPHEHPSSDGSSAAYTLHILLMDLVVPFPIKALTPADREDVPRRTSNTISPALTRVTILDEAFPVGEDERYFLLLNLQRRGFRALVDPGATRSYSGVWVSEFLKVDTRTVHGGVRVASDAVVPILGEIPVRFQIDRRTEGLCVRVAPLGYECVLGIDFSELFQFQIDYGQGTWTTPKTLP